EEFLESYWGRRVFFFWWLTADCGRSVSRWAGWSVFIAMLFAFVYYFLGPDYFASAYLKFNLSNMIYYSVVTFTTLGFGDITPKTTGAAMFVMCEVIIGYVMLGGLITIFASKLSRRGG
ncbi:MAG: ion channel, partial [Desulforhabdus sp.]|nr:ion channel [Desulforhabdus sp.]